MDRERLSVDLASIGKTYWTRGGDRADDADTTDRQASSGTLMVASLLPQCDEVPTACTARAEDAVAEQATFPARSVPCDSMR